MGFVDSRRTKAVYPQLYGFRADNKKKGIFSAKMLPRMREVTINPTGEPWYIDGQVSDILAELQETTVAPFKEREQIGTIAQTHTPYCPPTCGTNPAQENK